jgi:chemotaxis family two-component system sensor kinase Cph1
MATQNLNWTQLDQELIHLVNYIQPQGVLFALEEPSLRILQVSENIGMFFACSAQESLNQNFQSLLPPDQFQKFQALVSNHYLQTLKAVALELVDPQNQHQSLPVNAIVHRNSQGVLIVELEPYLPQTQIDLLHLYQLLRTAAIDLQKVGTLQALCQIMATEIRKIIQFDRVMIYKFNEDWSGHVIAEAKEDHLEPFLNLHFPDADTQSTRYLFHKNATRSIQDTEIAGVPLVPALHPQTQEPLDLSLSVLRGIALCHVDYLKNMGVQATFSMSIMKEDKLWGLVACHHYGPKSLNHEMRQTCQFLGQVVSVELLVKEEAENYEYRVHLKDIQTQLLASISKEKSFIQGLINYKPNLLDLVNAQGAAIIWGGIITTIGQVPHEGELALLLEWLESEVSEEVFSTPNLSLLCPIAEVFQETASGLLAIFVSPSNRILWFRPEFIQTVNWAGDPNHALQITTDAEGVVRSTPRGSFELWKQEVRGKSLPWQACEIEAAQQLRNFLVNIVLHQINELAKLAQELERSNAELEKFAYIASHDLQEPLNLVASYVQLLEMRYKSQLGKDGQEFIGFAVESVHHMQTLIDDLLTYSRVGSRSNSFEPVDLERLLKRVCRSLQSRIEESGATLTHEPLPSVLGDEMQIMQLFQNLLANALKFRRTDLLPQIHIGVKQLSGAWLFSVQDNGIGLESEFADRIFLIFQRLYTREEYPGTGIGLAICKKVIERHGGKIWVESELGQGATFFFTVPI